LGKAGEAGVMRQTTTPKGLHIPAQGKALGKVFRMNLAL